MKTTIDAVNEFKGEWATDDEMGPVTHIVMANINLGDYLKGDLKVVRGAVGNHYWKVICSHEEFNNLVLRLSSNFGKSISYETYKQSWKETSMTYTQEMHDNDVLPSVGMEVVARYNFDSKQVTHQGEVLYVSKYHVILNTIHGNEWHGLLDDFIMEPLPPVKTEFEIAQEKQVIDVAKEMEIENHSHNGVIFGYEEFITSAKHLQEKGMLAEIILPVDLVNGCFYEFDYLSVTMSGHFCSAFREFYVASEHKSFPYISCTNIIKLLTVEG
jgi:hypothetical protein